MSLAYVFLLLLRCVSIFSPGYVHPDEFFQSPEVMANKVLGFETISTWEWQGPTSPAPLLTTSGIMFFVLRLIGDSVYKLMEVDIDWFLMSGPVLFFAPRVGMLLGTLFIDRAVTSIARKVDTDENAAVLALGSSWPYLIMQTRPFSNSIETFLLALSLSIVAQSNTPRLFVSKRSTIRLLGAILAFGVFSRFTFVFYFFPVVLFILNDIWHFTGRAPFPERVQAIFDVIWLIVTGFAVVASMLVFVDSMFFGMIYFTVGGGRVSFQEGTNRILEGGHGLGIGGNVTLTPLNNLEYNMNPANLAVHGLHPRWLHAVVNAPMMFGPLAIVLYARGLPVITGFLGTHRKDRDRRIHSLRAAILGCAVGGMALLSLAPHQEPRFLLPMVVPLAVIFGRYVAGKRVNKALKLIWVVFNVLLFIFFGVLHQGSLVPATLMQSQAMVEPTRVSKGCVPHIKAHIELMKAHPNAISKLPDKCAPMTKNFHIVRVYHHVQLETHMSPTFPLKRTDDLVFTPDGWRFVTFTELKFNEDFRKKIGNLRGETVRILNRFQTSTGLDATSVHETVTVVHKHNDSFVKSHVIRPEGESSPFNTQISLENESVVCPMIATEDLPSSFDDEEKICLYVRSTETTFEV